MNSKDRERITDVINAHKVLLEDFEKSGPDTIMAVVEAIAGGIEGGGTVYICGNGGSAADAQHIAGELVGRFIAERKALPAVALSTDTSILTCIGNDYSFEDVFARQVEGLVRPGDVLWAFSTSGNSANVVKAAKLAKERGAVVIGFTGRSGSVLETVADICLCCEYPSTARSQEIHQLAYHIICELVEQRFIDR